MPCRTYLSANDYDRATEPPRTYAETDLATPPPPSLQLQEGEKRLRRCINLDANKKTRIK